MYMQKAVPTSQLPGSSHPIDAAAGQHHSAEMWPVHTYTPIVSSSPCSADILQPGMQTQSTAALPCQRPAPASRHAQQACNTPHFHTADTNGTTPSRQPPCAGRGKASPAVRTAHCMQCAACPKADTAAAARIRCSLFIRTLHSSSCNRLQELADASGWTPLLHWNVGQQGQPFTNAASVGDHIRPQSATSAAASACAIWRLPSCKNVTASCCSIRWHAQQRRGQRCTKNLPCCQSTRCANADEVRSGPPSKAQKRLKSCIEYLLHQATADIGHRTQTPSPTIPSRSTFKTNTPANACTLKHKETYMPVQHGKSTGIGSQQHVSSCIVCTAQRTEQVPHG